MSERASRSRPSCRRWRRSVLDSCPESRYVSGLFGSWSCSYKFSGLVVSLLYLHPRFPMSSSTSKNKRRSNLPPPPSTGLFSIAEHELNPGHRVISTRTQVASADGRRFKARVDTQPAPPSPEQPGSPALAEEDLVWNAEHETAADSLARLSETNGDDVSSQSLAAGPRTFATLVSELLAYLCPLFNMSLQTHDKVLLEWKAERQAFLDEVLRLEGLRGQQLENLCPLCRSAASCNTPEIRCEDCWGGAVICRACCLAGHANQPFHKLQVCLYAFLVLSSAVDVYF